MYDRYFNWFWDLVWNKSNLPSYTTPKTNEKVPKIFGRISGEVSKMIKIGIVIAAVLLIVWGIGKKINSMKGK